MSAVSIFVGIVWNREDLCSSLFLEPSSHLWYLGYSEVVTVDDSNFYQGRRPSAFSDLSFCFSFNVTVSSVQEKAKTVLRIWLDPSVA